MRSLPSTTPNADTPPQRRGTTPPRDLDPAGGETFLERVHAAPRLPRQTAVLPGTLHGMGGVGKSQVTIEYAHRHRHESDLVWWIQPEPPDLVLVLTALNLEYQAIRSHLIGPRTHHHPAGTIFEVGRLANGPQVALAVLGTGTAGAAALAERAIAAFQPAALLFVGIAGALKTHLNLGDVVIATKVYGYHGATDENGQHKARPEMWAASHALEQHARRVASHDTWTTLIKHVDQPRRAIPHVHFSAIASGEVVLNSRTTPLARDLDRTYNDAVAIEMESAGAAKAAQLRLLPTLTIRGISDKADGGKYAADRAGCREIAAANAAAFAAALVAQMSPT